MNRITKNKSNITVRNGDLFKMAKDRVLSPTFNCNVIVPHVCNNIGVFGGGFTRSLDEVFPIVKENFMLLGNKTKLGYVQFVSVLKEKTNRNQLVIANMIAQNGTINKNNTRPINYEQLVKCMIDVRRYAEIIKESSEQNVEIHCPKFGSSLAGGNWLFIEDLIHDIWKNINVFVYSSKAIVRQK
jgi:hypothetical protein